MSEYNGIVMIQVNNLSGRMEADEVKERVKELPQTYLAFTGSSGKSVKVWVRFTYPDDLLPGNREQAELFHAHAYRLAVKFYQPQLPFDIDLKEPSLEQYCRLTFDPELTAALFKSRDKSPLVGSEVLRRRVTSVYEHLPRSVTRAEVCRALLAAFQELWTVSLKPGLLTAEEEELADRLLASRYGQERWNLEGSGSRFF